LTITTVAPGGGTGRVAGARSFRCLSRGRSRSPSRRFQGSYFAYRRPPVHITLETAASLIALLAANNKVAFAAP
jgi:hypothetical protein